MRESVLLALIHIFSIVSTVNPGGVTLRGKKILRGYLRRYVNRELEEEYFSIFESNLKFYASELEGIEDSDLSDEDSLISFQITNICRQIKKGLFLDERMIVFLQLLEFVYEDTVVSDQEQKIVDIVARTFNIPRNEYNDAIAFMIGARFEDVNPSNLLIIGDEIISRHPISKKKNFSQWHKLHISGLKGYIAVLHIESTSTLIFTYDGPSAMYFKGRDIIPCRIYLLDRGVNIKGPDFEPIYYSKIYKSFIADRYGKDVLFTGNDVSYLFKNSGFGVKPFSFSVESGNLVGIMGGSGVGKTTLLNLLNGKLIPQTGSVCMNGHNISLHTETRRMIRGLIGYVPQDDLLIEELTVFQNLYFNGKLCFGKLNDSEIIAIVEKVMVDLDLDDVRDHMVGDVLNKKISGGQRKRLNIALELMREPSILFVDEPTSGLSSHDSAKVMNLLRQQALKGRIVFTIIHQPSSDIIKMFDRLWLLDKGGYVIYDGDAVDALVYFKTETSQANAAESECPNCGNVDTESILEIVESREVDNMGYPSKKRQISPEGWHQRYKAKIFQDKGIHPVPSKLPPVNYKLPSRIKMVKTFIRRNINRKLSDKQYITINLLEAPLLAFILGYFSKYSGEEGYTFAANINFPVFMFMAVIVALFLGLTVSAEEIFRDRKILEREKYLNISRLSYLLSKVGFLFVLSAIQSISFVLVANAILDVRGMTFVYWIILFSTACFGNMLGLNISAGMRSVVSIYILIPLILVPQLLLGGAMIKFDDLHSSISGKKYVPLIGDIMATRWAYEAIAVEQFAHNRFQEPFFEIERDISRKEWNATFLLPEMKREIRDFARNRHNWDENSFNQYNKLNYHIGKLSSITGYNFNLALTEALPDSVFIAESEHFLDSTRKILRDEVYLLSLKRDSIYASITDRIGKEEFSKLRQAYHNENLASMVLNRTTVKKVYNAEDMFLQKADPVYMEPLSDYGRAHFFSAEKKLGKMAIPTLWFNLGALWLMTILLFNTLYLNWLKKFLRFLENMGIPYLRRYASHLRN